MAKAKRQDKRNSVDGGGGGGAAARSSTQRSTDSPRDDARRSESKEGRAKEADSRRVEPTPPVGGSGGSGGPESADGRGAAPSRGSGVRVISGPLCECCDVRFSGDKQLQEHLQGKRHAVACVIARSSSAPPLSIECRQAPIELSKLRESLSTCARRRPLEPSQSYHITPHGPHGHGHGRASDAARPPSCPTELRSHCTAVARACAPQTHVLPLATIHRAGGRGDTVGRPPHPPPLRA